MNHKLKKVMWITLFVLYIPLGIFLFFKNDQLFKSYEIYYSLGLYEQKINQTTHYLDGYYFIAKLSKIIFYTLLLFIIPQALFRRIISSERSNEYLHYPKIVYDLKIFRKWSLFCSLLVFVIYFIFLNLNSHLHLLIQILIFLAVILVCIIPFVIVEKVVTYSVQKRILNYEESNYENVDSSEYEVIERPKKELFILKIMTIKLSMILSLLLVLSTIRFFQYKNIPEKLVLGDDFVFIDTLTSDVDKEFCYIYTNEVYFCDNYWNYDDFFNLYQIESLDLKIINEALHKGLESGDYTIMVKDGNSEWVFHKDHLTNLRDIHLDINNTAEFDYISVRINNGSYSIPIQDDQIQLKITFVKK